MAVKLPPLVQSIILDPTGVKAGAPVIAKGFQATSASATKATAAVKGLDAGLYSMSFRMQTVGRIMMKGFGLPILAAAGLAVNSFGKFEKELIKIEGLVGVSSKSVGGFAEGIKQIGRETGRAPQELAEAMFFVASAGLRGSVAMEVLAASAKGAAIGLGQTKSIVDAATSAVNAYGAENLTGSDAVDVLTAAVREGKVEAERLAPAIGKAIPVASAMGIEFHEVAAAIAAMTRTGTDARTSAIQLRQIMQSILDPSRQTEKALREMGIAQGELADQAREKGLLFVLKRLRDLANENEEAFADVFPNVRALAGALDITGENLKENEQIFAALSDSTGDTNKAFQNLEETVAFRFNKAITDLKVAFIEMGQSLTPLVTGFEVVFKVVSKFVKIITNTPIGSFILALGGAAAAGGLLMVVLGKLTQSALFFSIEMGKAAAATAAFSTTVSATGASGLVSKLFKLVRGPGGLAMLAVTAASVGLAFILMRKRTESTAEKLGKVRAQIRDVKSVAEISIKPMTAYAEAIRGVAEAISGDTTIFQSWQDQFEDMVADVFDDSTIEAGSNKVIQSLIHMFGGQDDTQEMRDSFNSLFASLSGIYGEAFEDEFLAGIFGTADQNEIMKGLLGTSGQFGTISFARTVALDSKEDIEKFARNVRNEYFDIIEKFNEGTLTQDDIGVNTVATTQMLAIMGTIDPTGVSRSFNAMEIAAGQADILAKIIKNNNSTISGAAKGMEDTATELVKATASGKWVVFADLYQGLIQGFFDTTDLEEGSTEFAFALDAWKHSIQTALADADEFTQDMDGSISRESDLLEFFSRIVDEAGKIDEGFLSDFLNEEKVRNWKDIAVFGRELQLVTADLADPETGLRAAFLSSGLEESVFLIQLAAKRMSELKGEEIESENPLGLRTVKEVFEALTTEMAEASAEAKNFEDKFDNLTRAAFEFHDAQIGMVDGLQSFANAARDSGGSMDLLSSKGRKTRSALIDAAKGAIEFASAGIASGEFTQNEGVKMVEETIDSLRATAKMYGVSADEFEGILAPLSQRTLSLVAAPDRALIQSESFEQQLQALEDGILGFIDFSTMKNQGANSLLGFNAGMISAAPVLKDTIYDILGPDGQVVRWSQAAIDARSPSVLFAKKVGEPITAGIAKGILDEKGKIRFTIKELVNETISDAQNTIGAVNNAIIANLDLESARANFQKAMRDFGKEGEITKRESLTRKQLERDLKDAERSMRLGTGHQEDLELSLLDAQQALEDFDANVTSGAPTTQATVDLLQAGLQMGDAVAKMKMEGDKAIELFTNLGETMGLPMDDITSALAVAESNIDVYRNMFDNDVLEAIERAADAFIIISSGGRGDAPIAPPDLSGGNYDWTTGDAFIDANTEALLTSLGVGFNEGGGANMNLMGVLGTIGYNNSVARTPYDTTGIGGTMVETPEVTELKTIDQTLQEGFGTLDFDLRELARKLNAPIPKPFTNNYGYKIDFTSTDPNDYSGWAGGLQ